jgi:hypothetical protein
MRAWRLSFHPSVAKGAHRDSWQLAALSIPVLLVVSHGKRDRRINQQAAHKCLCERSNPQGKVTMEEGKQRAKEEVCDLQEITGPNVFRIVLQEDSPFLPSSSR